MRTALVSVDGKEYTLRELRHRKNKTWRKELEGHITRLTSSIAQTAEAEVTEVKVITQLVRDIAGFLLNSIDVMCELIIMYAPSMEEAIEDAYDSEITDVFLEVLKLAYPFSSMIDTLKRLGADVRQTMPS